jgi:hypothetical protein
MSITYLDGDVDMFWGGKIICMGQTKQKQRSGQRVLLVDVLGGDERGERRQSGRSQRKR